MRDSRKRDRDRKRDRRVSTGRRLHEFLTEPINCPSCLKTSRFIANDKFVRCPECTYYTARDKSGAKVTNVLYLEKESQEL